MLDGSDRKRGNDNELLGIPDIFKVIAVIPVGVPDETPAPKERKSLETIVSWEKFGSKSQ
jgi:nitroreductase